MVGGGWATFAFLWSFVELCQRRIYSFSSIDSFVGCWVPGALYMLWILDPYWIYDLLSITILFALFSGFHFVVL